MVAGHEEYQHIGSFFQYLEVIDAVLVLAGDTFQVGYQISDQLLNVRIHIPSLGSGDG